MTAEIAGRWDLTNDHGVDLRAGLLDVPQRRTYVDSFDDGAPIRLWLVLEEDRVGHAGYEVVFDETRRWFGLATPGEKGPVLIGFHGSFLETFAAM